MKRFYSYCIVPALLLVAATGCKKNLNINSDPANPQNPSNSSVFPAMLAGIPRGVQYDARYVGKYIQNWNSTSSADTWDRMGYIAASDAGADIWRQTYFGLGKNLDYIIQNGVTASQFDYVGACYALKALMFQYCTDLHGEIIFHEAFKEGTYYFMYDTQDAVYKGVDSLCRIAISYLDQAQQKATGNTLYIGDYVYKGDVLKWKRFVYGILARNWHHTTNKASYKPDSVIKFCTNSLASVDDDFDIPFDASRNDDANFYGTYRDNLATFRQSNFIVHLLDGSTLSGGFNPATRDPRITHMLSASQDTSGTNNGGYRGVDPTVGDPYNGVTTGANARKRVAVPWGDSIYANPSASSFTGGSPGKYLFQNKAVMPVMTLAEIKFIQAEAEYRKGDKASALTSYLAGINAHFDFINRNYSGIRSNVSIFSGSAISAAARSAYLAGANVKQNAAALTLSDIMLQKYIALWGWGWIETWVDLRRYHYSKDQENGTAVYKNFALPVSIYPDNAGNPVYRLRPRYNSEYVWNLDQLKRFGGEKANYHTIETWFSQPQ